MQCVCAMDYNSALKRNGGLTRAEMWVIIRLLSESSQSRGNLPLSDSTCMKCPE